MIVVGVAGTVLPVVIGWLITAFRASSMISSIYATPGVSPGGPAPDSAAMLRHIHEMMITLTIGAVGSMLGVIFLIVAVVVYFTLPGKKKMQALHLH